METMTLDKDIKVLYKTAASFPEGVLDAHEHLHALFPNSAERKYFGISRPENGTIVYRAAAEEKTSGEAEQLQCDTLVVKQGKYIYATVEDYMKDVQSIGTTFQQLLSSPNLDPNGYCVEWYLNDKDVKCMIRLRD
jgi:predicted transcriptional regulator YdeE